jgi:hypothetical protein
MAATTTTQFFEAVFHKGLPSTSTLEVRIDTGGSLVQLFHETLESVVEAVRPYYSSARSIWFGPGLRFGRGGSDNDVRWLSSLWVDCDAKCFPNNTKQEAYDHLRTFKLPPDIIIDSGHGMQGYWRFSSYLTGEAILRGRGAMRVLQNLLSEQLPRRLDPVHNPSRMMRLPNTMNRKEEHNPQPCRVVYNMSTTSGDRILAQLSAAVVLEVITPSYDDALFSAERVYGPADVRPLLQKALAAGMSDWVQDALLRPDLHHKGDTSRLDFAVCIGLTKYLSLAEAEVVWRYSPLGLRPGDNKVQERVDYRRRTLWRAREEGKSNSADG